MAAFKSILDFFFPKKMFVHLQEFPVIIVSIGYKILKLAMKYYNIVWCSYPNDVFMMILWW